MVQQLKANVKAFTGPYAFIDDYEYTLGADELTHFGQQQMVNSGVKFYQRYQALASKYTPFLRSAGQSRVVESAQNWTQGYHAAKLVDRQARPRGDSVYPYEILPIPEDEGLNNTLNHEICTDFEDGWYKGIADAAQKEWADIFAAPIRDRLNHDMPGANLSTTQTIYMMDLCPFNTVASDTGAISLFCSLFSEEEWHQYNYYEVCFCFESNPKKIYLTNADSQQILRLLIRQSTRTNSRSGLHQRAHCSHDQSACGRSHHHQQHPRQQQRNFPSWP